MPKLDYKKLLKEKKQQIKELEIEKKKIQAEKKKLEDKLYAPVNKKIEELKNQINCLVDSCFDNRYLFMVKVNECGFDSICDGLYRISAELCVSKEKAKEVFDIIDNYKEIKDEMEKLER